MSLLFGGASSDRVEHGTGITLGTSFTVLLWEYPTSDTGPQIHWWKTATGGVIGRHSLERKFGDVDDYEIIVDRGTTYANTATTGVDRPLNAWKFIALRFVDGDGGPRLFHGSLTASAVEASYSTRTDGLGALASTAGTTMLVGNRSSLDEVFVGRIAALAVYPDRALSLGEIIEWQWSTKPAAGCKLLSHYGFAGTGTQPDWSGSGNSGTVTGATVAAHVPLGPVFASQLSMALAAAPNMTRALTGVAGTGAVGSVAPSLSVALTGVTGTGAAGTPVANVSYGATGVAGTGAVGSVAQATSYTLAGVVGTGAAGTVVSNITYGLTGVAATGEVGTLAGAVAYGLSGNAATGAAGSVGVNVTYALTGVQATGAVGSVTVTGNDVTKALTGVQATGEVGNVTAVGGDVTARVHGFEMGGEEPKKRRRNLVTIIRDVPPDASVSKPTITKADIDRRRFATARDEAREVIARAAVDHASEKHTKAERFAQVRTSLKPLAPTLGGWNWIAVYQRMYQDALDEQLRQEMAREDAIAEQAAEEDERALMELVMEWM